MDTSLDIHADSSSCDQSAADSFDDGYNETDKRFAEPSGFDYDSFFDLNYAQTTRELAEELNVSVQTVTNTARRILDPSKVHWRVVNGGRSRIFTSHEATEIKNEIQRHHNLKQRWHRYSANEEETDFGIYHDTDGGFHRESAPDGFGLLLTQKEVRRRKRRTRNVLTGKNEKLKATDAESGGDDQS